jgi:tRNA(Met) C34 N-acetyltransferase TmcA
MVVSKILGHAKPSITLDVYSDLYPEDLAAAVETVAKTWPKGRQLKTAPPA